jgi:hypothetical protein
MHTGDVKTVVNNSTSHCLGKVMTGHFIASLLSGILGTFSYTKMKSIKHTKVQQSPELHNKTTTIIINTIIY